MQLGCLFGLAVDCDTARLSIGLRGLAAGLVNCTNPGTNPGPGAKLSQVRML